MTNENFEKLWEESKFCFKPGLQLIFIYQMGEQGQNTNMCELPNKHLFNV